MTSHRIRRSVLPTLALLSFASSAFAAARADAAAAPMTWRIEYHSNAVGGEKACTLVSWGGDLAVRLRRDETAAAWSVTVGPDSQPGSLRYLRIDRHIHTSAEAQFSGAEAGAIVAQLKAGTEFAFEWARRPDYAKQAGLFSTGDFAAKAATCEDWIKGDPI